MSSGKKKSKSVDVAELILTVCKGHPAANQGGVPQKQLEEALAAKGIKKEDMLMGLNAVLGRGKLVACPNMDRSLSFRVQSDEEAAKLNGLTAEERLVYQEIEQAATSGASTKDLRTKSSLPAPQLTKALKTLETRKLVRQVKSVAAKNKKIYMLAGLEPGKEITGGTWYSDQQEFDHELIRHLREAAVGFIQREHQATVAQVHEFVNNSGLVIGKLLEVSDIESVLESLVSDARIECDKQLGTRGPGGGILYEKLYRMRPAFFFVDHDIRAFTSLPSCQCLTCTGDARAVWSGREQYVPCPTMTAWLAAACELSG